MTAASYRTTGRVPARPEPTVIPAGVLVEDAGRVAVRFAVGTITLPVEIATTALNILRLTEQLMEETVLTLRAARPVLEGVSTAYQAGHFDPLFRTIGQIQQSANAIAFVWTPIDVVRGVVAPADRTIEWHPQNVVRAITARPAGGGPSGVFAPVGWAVVIAKQAGSLPGAGLVTGSARRLVGTLPRSRNGRAPGAAVDRGAEAGPPALRIPALDLRLPRIDLHTPSLALQIPSIRVRVPLVSVRTPSVALPRPALPGWAGGR